MGDGLRPGPVRRGDADGGLISASDLPNFQVLFSSNLLDWIVLPGGNLGNVSAFGKGLRELHQAGFIDRMAQGYDSTIGDRGFRGPRS